MDVFTPPAKIPCLTFLQVYHRRNDKKKCSSVVAVRKLKTVHGFNPTQLAKTIKSDEPIAL